MNAIRFSGNKNDIIDGKKPHQIEFQEFNQKFRLIYTFCWIKNIHYKTNIPTSFESKWIWGM